MNIHNIDNALQMIQYGNALMDRVRIVLPQLKNRNIDDSMLDIKSRNIYIENSFEFAMEYHMRTQANLEQLLAYLYRLSPSPKVAYTINHINIAKQIIDSYDIAAATEQSKNIKFDFRSYLKSTTSYVVREINESIEYLYLKHGMENNSKQILKMCLKCLENMDIYTKSCTQGDLWDEKFFELELYEQGNVTSNKAYVDRVFKMYRRAYLINCERRPYIILPGLVSVWRNDETGLSD